MQIDAEIAQNGHFNRKSGAATTPLKLILENIKILPIRRCNQLDRMGPFLNKNFIPIIYLKSLLSVER